MSLNVKKLESLRLVSGESGLAQQLTFYKVRSLIGIQIEWMCCCVNVKWNMMDALVSSMCLCQRKTWTRRQLLGLK